MSTDNEFEDVKNRVSCKDIAAKLLQPQGKTYICPACGSGTHKNKTSALEITNDGRHWTCFSCHEEGDVFDLVAVACNLKDDKRAQLEKVAELGGIVLQSKAGSTAKTKASSLSVKPGQVETANSKPTSTKDAYPAPEQAAKHVQKVLAAAQANIEKDDAKKAVQYLTERGFSKDDIQRFGFGYNPSTNAIVIPWPGGTYYAQRLIDPKENQSKYLNAASKNAGVQPLFNEAALDNDIVFLVEGLLDAYAIMAAGFDNVVALATNNISDKALETFTATGYKGVAVLALDNDEKGQQGAQRVRESLDKAGILSIEGNAAPEGYKDAADVLEEDVEKLKAHYSQLQHEAEEKKVVLEAQQLARIGLVSPADTASTLFSIGELQDPIPTGIKGIDRIMGGGLGMGLHVLGAGSSLGKTTLAIQIADNIAASGYPVLFVSIEQTERELVSKTLSRLSRKVAGLKGKRVNPDGVIPSNEILNKKKRLEWGEKKNAVFLKACEELSGTIAPYMRHWHPTRKPAVNDILERAVALMGFTGRPPVVFIDYLQIIAANERDSEKQAIDRNITDLRYLASSLGSPVFVVSSLSREGYYMPIDQGSFKESGGIEYGADVLLGLQPRNFENNLGYHNSKGEWKWAYGEQRKTIAKRIYTKTKTSDLRELELVFLKNRNGANPKKPLPLDFLPVSMLFNEPPKEKDVQDAADQANEDGLPVDEAI